MCTSGVVLGFSVSAVKTAAQLAKQRQVTVLTHNVIYKLLEELRVRGPPYHMHPHLSLSTILPLPLTPPYHKHPPFPHQLSSPHHPPLQDSLQDKLPSVVEEVVVGEAAVLKTFKLTGARAALVGGCRVKKGQLVRDGIYRLLRDGEVRFIHPLCLENTQPPP